MLGDVIRACMAREILVQLSTDTYEFEKYSRGATKYTRVTRTRASSLNRAVPYYDYSRSYLSLKSKNVIKFHVHISPIFSCRVTYTYNVFVVIYKL